LRKIPGSGTVGRKTDAWRHPFLEFGAAEHRGCKKSMMYRVYFRFQAYEFMAQCGNCQRHFAIQLKFSDIASGIASFNPAPGTMNYVVSRIDTGEICGQPDDILSLICI
jgi:hypothetical protein